MSEPPLHDFIDMEAYDVVPGALHRALREQLGIAAVALGRIADGTCFEDCIEGPPTCGCEQRAAREALLRMREIESS